MGIILSSVASVTLSAVVCNVIGAAILHHVHPNAAYDVSFAAKAGAVGGAILAIPWLIIATIINACIAHSPAWVHAVMAYADWVIGAANSAAAGALGAKVLIESRGRDKAMQGVAESAATGGVGFGIWLAAWSTLAIVMMSCMVTFKGVGWMREQIEKRRGGGNDGHPFSHELESREQAQQTETTAPMTTQGPIAKSGRDYRPL
ncbi:hypothetical protein QFC19_008847 [Naganishia cerealis]|uniref:Uncharacterized protein n=1 Tax=Naganishia cerealis TaxID=610337 RepID=A0ACC2UZ14_9TREE|nr:hypothetical protein QFC19_008847 [Naganishia cerealis]